MSGDSRNLNYEGPDRQYEPPVGSNPAIRKFASVKSGNQVEDLFLLRKSLLKLEEKSNLAISMSEEELSELFLDLNSSEQRKNIANNIWSNFNEKPNNLVSFKQLKESEDRSDRSS